MRETQQEKKDKESSFGDRKDKKGDFRGGFRRDSNRMLSMEETSKANLLHWKVLQVRWVK